MSLRRSSSLALRSPGSDDDDERELAPVTKRTRRSLRGGAAGHDEEKEDGDQEDKAENGNDSDDDHVDLPVAPAAKRTRRGLRVQAAGHVEAEEDDQEPMVVDDEDASGDATKLDLCTTIRQILTKGDKCNVSVTKKTAMAVNVIHCTVMARVATRLDRVADSASESNDLFRQILASLATPAAGAPLLK